MIANAKVKAVHLERSAYIYARQSTEYQVQNNIESQQRQYELAELAIRHGWPKERVVLIDDDLGRSGSSVAGRTGFARLVADVALSKAGIVFGLEVSRLARNNRDWYQLLDLCSMTLTLIADADGVMVETFSAFSSGSIGRSAKAHCTSFSTTRRRTQHRRSRPGWRSIHA